jgi:hypothetical protein
MVRAPFLAPRRVVAVASGVVVARVADRSRGAARII